MHSGAGSFTIDDMRTMSWQALGVSDATIKLADLFPGFSVEVQNERTEPELIIEQ